MYTEPDNPAVTDRMRAAHQRAAAALGVRPDGGGEAWGWRGRTLSGRVAAHGEPAWLRVACGHSGQIDRTFWEGSLHANTAIPTAVPRPRLVEVRDFGDDTWQYRAELYEYIDAAPVASTPVLVTQAHLPQRWWAGLRDALDTVGTVSTDRYTTEQEYLDWAMPEFLGVRLDTSVPAWATAHGDLHWANISGPRLLIFDWEGWGLAPVGYDAAMLHSCTLLVPETAQCVRNELAHVLDTPAGRFAELVAITELLHGTTRGDNLHLAERLRQRAAHLLQHRI